MENDCFECWCGLFIIFFGIPLFIISHVIAFSLALVLTPILVPIYMIKGDWLFINFWPRLPWYFALYFMGWSDIFKCTIIICNCLLCFIPCRDCCKSIFTNGQNERQTNLNTVTGQVPPPTVTRQPITTQPTTDLDEMNFQTAVLQSQLHDLNRQVSNMNIVQNQPVETTPLPSPESDALECSICSMDMRAESHFPMVFDPCGHTCCKNCASQITECHMCRSNIVRKNRVYFY